MLEFRRRFTPYGLHCSLKYIVECTPEQYMVRCGDGCRGVARCGNPTVEQVNNVLEELDASDDFDLVRTENIEGTVEFLATVTAELHQRLDSGDFDALAFGSHEETATDTKKGSQPQQVAPWTSVDMSPDSSPTKKAPTKNPSMPSPEISPVRPSPLTTDSPQKSLLWNTTKTSPFKDTADFRSKARGYSSSPSPEKTVRDYFPVSPANGGQGSKVKGNSCRKSLNPSLSSTKSAEERMLASPSRKRAVRKTQDFGDNSPLPKVQAMYDPTEYSRNRYKGDFDEASPEDLEEESQEFESTEEKYLSIQNSRIETKPTSKASKRLKNSDSGFEDGKETKCLFDNHVSKASTSSSSRKRPVASRISVFDCDSDSDNELPDITDAPSPHKQRKSNSVKSLNPNTCKKKLGLESKTSNRFDGHRQWIGTSPSKNTWEDINASSKDTKPSARSIHSEESELETVSLLDDSQETKDSDDDYDLNLWSMTAHQKQKNSEKEGLNVDTSRTKTKDSIRKTYPKFGPFPNTTSSRLKNTEEPSTSRVVTKQSTSSSLPNKTHAFLTSNQELETISLLDDSQETRHSDDDFDQEIWPRPTDESFEQEAPLEKLEAGVEKWSEKVQLVKAVLPQCEDGIVLMMLQNNDGNVEAVVSALLDQADG